MESGRSDMDPNRDRTPAGPRRWVVARSPRPAGAHRPGPHLATLARDLAGGHRRRGIDPKTRSGPSARHARRVEGEGGGQILRTALTLSLLTGRPFRIVKVRANRDKPGLRPQHLTAVQAAAELGDAEVSGAEVGSRDLTFRPGPYTPRDLSFDIGTAGSTALVLQTLHLPLALRADRPVRLTLTGGTFNATAPSFPFLEATWRAHLAALGMPDRPGDALGRVLTRAAAAGSTPGSSRPSPGRST